MTERPDRILWDLPRVDADDDGRVPSDDRLRAWRAGRLSELETRRTEWALSRSARARERLVELSGVRLAEPPARIRRRIVGRSPLASWRPLPRWSYVAAAAILIGVMLSVAVLLQGPRPTGALPGGAEFDVAVFGQAVVRDAAGPAETRPDGSVRILVEPRSVAISGVEFGVYVERDGRLRRLGAGDGITVDHRRGAATLIADAGALTGGAGSGAHEFFVAVAPAGRLAASVETLPGVSHEVRLAEATGGRAYRRTVTIQGGARRPVSE